MAKLKECISFGDRNIREIFVKVACNRININISYFLMEVRSIAHLEIQV